MQSSEIAISHRYGMRLKAAAGEPLIEVNVIEMVGRMGHIKVQHLGARRRDSRNTRLPITAVNNVPGKLN